MLGTGGAPVSRLTVLNTLVHSGATPRQDYLQCPAPDRAYTLLEHLRALGAAIEP